MIEQRERHDKGNNVHSNTNDAAVELEALNPSNETVIDAPFDNNKGSSRKKCNSSKLFIGGVVLLAVAGVIAAIASSVHSGSEELGSDPHAYYTSANISSMKTFSQSAIASDSGICSDIGRDIIMSGGSGVDAAISSLFCLGVVHPHSSGIGGGGFMTVRSGNGSVKIIDFREQAPIHSTKDMFFGRPEASLLGGLAVAVPGELAGLVKAHNRHGLLEWKRLVTPIAKLAREGVSVDTSLARALEKSVLKMCEHGGIFCRSKGVPLQYGDLLIQKELAETLDVIAEHGLEAIYGPNLIGRDIVDAVLKAGGNMTLVDLDQYRPIIREPVHMRFGKDSEYSVFSAPAPASGSIISVILGICDMLPKDVDSGVRYHYLVESMKFAYAKRSQLGDPHFLPNNNFDDIASIENISKLYSYITENSHHTSYYGAAYDQEPTPGTTHLSIITRGKQSVSVTSTINTYFGSGISVRGIMLNNEMDDFSQPNVSNFFGLRPSPSNFIAPGKRPISSASPVIIVHDNEVIMAAGASGGSRITTSTAQVILSVLLYGRNLYDAVKAPRLHNQLTNAHTTAESSFSEAIVNQLVKKQHSVTWLRPGVTQSVVQAVHLYNDTLIAVSDPRKGGEPAGI